MTLHKRMRQPDIDEGTKPGNCTGESAALRDARRRIRLLEQENEVLRRPDEPSTWSGSPRTNIPASRNRPERRNPMMTG